MNSKTRKILNRRWRGLSYRCGGLLFQELKHKSHEKLEAL